jgi:SRSO17 transposase
MAGASIETTLELWASSLREVKRRIRSLFAQGRTAASAGLFIDGLLGEERRKTGWMRAEAAGDPGPWRQQELLGRDRWDADALRDLVRDYVIEQLAHDDAVLVIDETGFLKQGKASCGVARQYTGSAGKVTNCQIGVFAAYVSRHGHAFVDRALYLPKSWIDDPARLKATHVPSDISFATKPRLAAVMIERAIAAGAPFGWVAADTVYGVGDIERDLRRAGKGYVLGVDATHIFRSWDKPRRVAGTAAAIAEALRPSDWRRLPIAISTRCTFSSSSLLAKLSQPVAVVPASAKPPTTTVAMAVMLASFRRVANEPSAMCYPLLYILVLVGNTGSGRGDQRVLKKCQPKTTEKNNQSAA